MCAYQFGDGFDNYQDSTQIYDSTQLTNGGIVYASSHARFPAPAGLTGQGVVVNQNSWARKNLLSNQATLICGIAFRFPALGTNPEGFLAFEDANSTQTFIAVLANGSLQFYRATTSNPIGSASAAGLIFPNVWYGLVIQVTINSSTGSVQAWLNGGASQIINSSGLNTQATGNAFAGQMRFGDFQNARAREFDDLYVYDTSGGTQNANPGDSRIITKMPNGAGNSTQWTPSAGSNWQCVDEIPPNDDTDYVSSSTAGQTDLYTTQSASLSSAAPNFVVTRRRHRKDDAGAHTDQSIIRSGSTNASSTAVAVPSTYAFVDDIFVNDPNTAAAWASGTAADAIQIGVVETS